MSATATCPRSRFVHAGGCRVHALEWGEPGRPPVLLLHGGMAHAHWWDPVAATLAERLHVFAADMPGHGDSPWLEPPRYAHVERAVVDDLLATLGRGPWTLGGHSQGGLHAVVAATGERAGMVARLVLVDVPLDPAAPALVRSGAGFRRMPQLRWRSREEAMAAFRLFPRDGDAPPAVLRELAGHSVREDGDGRWTSKFDWRYFRGRDPHAPSPYAGFGDRLRRIASPALVVRGERSSILSADDHAEMLARIPSARGAVIAGAGHNPHVERADETARAIVSFVVG